MMFYIDVNNDESNVFLWLFPHLPVYFYRSCVHTKKCICHFTNRRSQLEIKVLNWPPCVFFPDFIEQVVFIIFSLLVWIVIVAQDNSVEDGKILGTIERVLKELKPFIDKVESYWVFLIVQWRFGKTCWKFLLALTSVLQGGFT